MATTPSNLEDRLGKLESRQERTDEDSNALMETLVEARDDVKTLRHDVSRLRLDFTGLTRKLLGLHNDVDRLTSKIDGVEGKVDVLYEDVGWLKRGMHALLAHQGLTVEPDDPAQ